MVMFLKNCPDCGLEIPNGALFCPYCAWNTKLKG
jgi:hypothetical protein